MNNKETEIFLENFFLYKWTNLKDDLQNLKSVKDLLKKNNTKIDPIIKNISTKFIEQKNNQIKENNDFCNSKETLDLVSSIIFLRDLIINKNKKKILPIDFKNFENIKVEYAHLRVELLKNIKEKFSFKKYQEKNSTLSHDEYIQKIADKLEDKYHSIKNELGYEFLIYKEIKLIKILNKPNNYIIINSKQKIQRPLDNKDIN
ncbi:MAG: hypothetical protein VXY52_01290 [Pseudomonadota bacterium]|nr:hypothetical protein [Pseudomonadota bacterium]MEC8497652.1 hypothetical protein [Pseudomonadota bacterium]MEC8797564.1 hypothetical protein [Pseudomonadota bacterium]|tara:strand:- start:1964 stop:2572 length:609 start_codon:yes stop_codon:yes gene_type:complete